MATSSQNFHAARHALDHSMRMVLLWFGLIVVLLAGVLGLTAMGMVRYTAWSKQGFDPSPGVYQVAGALGVAFALLVIVLSTLQAQRRLRRDVGTLPQQLGGIEVHATATHPAARRLIHVIEEMALATQQPAPRIFVLAHEPGINACALSWEGGSPALCVTLGCLYRLRRDELQAVVALGFNTLLHHDPTRRLRIMGLIAGLQGSSALGWYLMVPTITTKKGKAMNPAMIPVYPLAAVLGMALLVAGAIGYGLGALLNAAAVRKRIRLGDAATCEFTRDPLALASAFRQVGGFILGSRLLGKAAKAYQPLFLLRTTVPFLDLFDTHPPLERRIRVLDPSWDGAYPVSRVVAGIAKEVQKVG